MGAKKAASLVLLASIFSVIFFPVASIAADIQKWPVERDAISVSYTVSKRRDALESARVRITIPLDPKKKMTQAVPYTPDRRNVSLVLVTVDPAIRMDDFGISPKPKLMGPELKTWTLVPVNRFPSDVMNFEMQTTNDSDSPQLDPCKKYALEVVIKRSEKTVVGRQRTPIELPDKCTEEKK